MNLEDKELWREVVTPSGWICFGVTVAYGVFGLVMFLL